VRLWHNVQGSNSSSDSCFFIGLRAVFGPGFGAGFGLLGSGYVLVGSNEDFEDVGDVGDVGVLQ